MKKLISNDWRRFKGRTSTAVGFVAPYMRPEAPFSELGWKFLAWCVPGFFAFFVCRWLEQAVWTSNYLSLAIGQGVSPELWNVIGVIGLVLAGATIATAKWPAVSQILGRASSAVLLASFEVGLLAFGLLAAEAIVVTKGVMAQVWNAWFFGGLVGVTFILVLCVMLFPWFVARIIHGPLPDKQSRLLIRLGEAPAGYTLFIGLLVMAGSLCLLLLER